MIHTAILYRPYSEVWCTTAREYGLREDDEDAQSQLNVAEIRSGPGPSATDHRIYLLSLLLLRVKHSWPHSRLVPNDTAALAWMQCYVL